MMTDLLSRLHMCPRECKMLGMYTMSTKTESNLAALSIGIYRMDTLSTATSLRDVYGATLLEVGLLQGQ